MADSAAPNGMVKSQVLVTKVDQGRVNHLRYTASNGMYLGEVDCWFASPEAARAIIKELAAQILGVVLP